MLDGADHVGRFFVGVVGKGLPDVSVRTVELNGGPAVLVLSGGKPDTVVQIDADGDRIRTVYVVRNPDKLATSPRSRRRLAPSRRSPAAPCTGAPARRRLVLTKSGGRPMVAESETTFNKQGR